MTNKKGSPEVIQVLMVLMYICLSHSVAPKRSRKQLCYLTPTMRKDLHAIYTRHHFSTYLRLVSELVTLYKIPVNSSAKLKNVSSQSQIT